MPDPQQGELAELSPWDRVRLENLVLLWKKLEARSFGDQSYLALRSDALQDMEPAFARFEVQSSWPGLLDAWRSEYPAGHISELSEAAEVAPAVCNKNALMGRQSLARWIEEQRARGRGIVMVGNIIQGSCPPDPLRVVATKYAEVAFGMTTPGQVAPQYVVYEPAGGWKSASEIEQMSNTALIFKYHWPVFAASAGLLAVLGLTWGAARSR